VGSILLQSCQVLPRHVRLPYWPGCEIEDLVAVLLDVSEELAHSLVAPVLAEVGKHVPEHVRARDGSVYIRYHNLGLAVVEVNFGMLYLLPLQNTMNREEHVVGSRL